ncbi:hypothetical protein KFK09_009537 [Dendrobium nobile]|uniref:Uncharacterized protein n=1 Tax=Dendrobium nobile TaxID=94219 RepID=A0A8T3BLP8_DENNO|nr:hypothetical protein KFK09_009537 [Dendrobium nobile]
MEVPEKPREREKVAFTVGELPTLASDRNVGFRSNWEEKDRERELGRGEPRERERDRGEENECLVSSLLLAAQADRESHAFDVRE